MKRHTILWTLLLGAICSPAVAGEACGVPYSPVVPDGVTASREDILVLRDDVTRFLGDSDRYQACLILYLEQRQVAAQREGEPMNAVIEASLRARIAANQREKVKIGEEFNTAVREFNAANPDTSD